MLFAVELIGIALMLTLMFILIWSFILLKQIFNQMKYRNYLLEKLTQHVHMLSKKEDV